MQKTDDTVWSQSVDGGDFTVEVESTGGYQGKLVVYSEKDEEIIHEEEVGLAYNALFGPDHDDVEQWKETALRVIDEYVGR